MVFSSLSFLFLFFPLVVGIYYILPNRVWRNTVLLLASLLFYAWGEPKFVLVMIASVAAAYVGGLLIVYFKKPSLKRVALIATVAVLVGLLLIFKYLNLFVDTVNALFSGSISMARIVLPIGISFYTFQILSYVIDLYLGRVALQKNFFYLLLYVCFFPQLIAGPIVRYETVEDEIRNRKESFTELIFGLERFIFGLSKKVLLANQLAKVADGLYATDPSAAGTLLMWVAIVAYALQIYFDFSGYSDMAIGIGRMFGFHFLENFNYPYVSRSITDFWRRWHISLSTWFRDYIYIPMGGNRVSKWRHILNLLTVWALTGFWHGAQWSFLLWGLYYGVILILEKYLLAPVIKRLPAVVGWLYSFILVLIGWIIFYHGSVADILDVLKTMFVYTSGNALEVLAAEPSVIASMVAIPFGFLFAFPLFQRFCKGEGTAVTVIREIVCIGLLILCIIFLVSSTYNPFIYFRF